MDGFISRQNLIYCILGALSVVSFVVFIFFIKLDCNLWLKFYATFWTNKKKLNGRVVWIVGSSTGIGEEMAYQLAKRNCKLILTSTTESKLEDVKKTCLERSKGKLVSDDILVLAYDISDFSKSEEAFKQVIDKFGQLDILICNAARGSTSIIMEEETEDIKKLFDVNFFSHVHITKLVLRHWLALKAKDGAKTLNKQILVTSAVLSVVELPFASSYSATKQSLNTFFHDVAMQTQPDGIYVTIALPGPVESAFANNSKIQGNRKFNEKSLTRMKTKRCVHLMLVSLANRLHETYVTNQPFLTFTYLYKFCGYYMMQLIRTFGLAKSLEKKIFVQ